MVLTRRCLEVSFSACAICLMASLRYVSKSEKLTVGLISPNMSVAGRNCAFGSSDSGSLRMQVTEDVNQAEHGCFHTLCLSAQGAGLA